MAHDGVKTFYMHAPAFFRQIAHLILGSERKQQLRISRSLTAAFVFLACIGLQVYAYRHGFMEVQYVWRLSIVIVVNIVFWYALLRSGLNLRFRDPALTLPQVLAALTIIVYAYSVTGRIHGSIMMLLTLVQVFGIFNMSQRDSRLAGLYSLGLMGCAMVYKTQTDPTNYPYQVEIAHFILIAAILPTISSLAAQLNNMRARLQSQKNELAQALTRIQILATRDELTGLFNRRHMLDVLTQHQKRLIRAVDARAQLFDVVVPGQAGRERHLQVGHVWQQGAGSQQLTGPVHADDGQVGRGVVDQQQEFFAPPAGEHVGVTQGALQRRGKLAQHLVAHAMALGVVDAL